MNRKFRLRSKADIDEVRRAGRTCSSSRLVLIARPNGLEFCRFAFSVSRRIGSSVRRNRVRRVLRESARLRLDQLCPGWDILIIARAPIAEAGFSEADEALTSLLVRASLLRPVCDSEEAPRFQGACGVL